MKLLSVNVGLPREVSWHGKSVRTSIWKNPVKGPLRVGALNVEGDRQSDLSVHGGAAKAVYAYPSEHYSYWRLELPGMELPWGAFGENFTTQGALEEKIQIGDRLRIGSAEFVVTQPRMPCFKLGIRFGRPDMVKRFLRSGRTGFYLSVVREGQVAAGDSIDYVAREKHGVTVSDIVSLYTKDAEMGLRKCEVEMEPIRIRQLMAAIDFSDWTSPVLRSAKEIALRYGAGMTIVHSEMFLPPPYFTVGGMEKISVSSDLQREAARRYLEETVQRELGDADVANARLVEAVPSEGILHTAESLPADLIVMGTHGRHGFNRLLLGSVAENVLRLSDVPVITIRGAGDRVSACQMPFHRILCPLNDSQVAQEALRYAADFAERFQAELTLMNSLEDGEPDSADMTQQEKKLCDRVPERVRAHCAVKGVVRKGEAAEQILQVAAERASDLIVIGAQHRPFWDVTVWGTTTERVMRHAACPVLSVIRSHDSKDKPASS